jgi:hypothetical protein
VPKKLGPPPVLMPETALLRLVSGKPILLRECALFKQLAFAATQGRLAYQRGKRGGRS